MNQQKPLKSKRGGKKAQSPYYWRKFCHWHKVACKAEERVRYYLSMHNKSQEP